MYANGKTVRIHKGFFDFEEFYDTLMLLDDIEELSIVMHFRISTHGSVNKACCHPFPVTDDMAKLSATDTENRVCVAHNGVISGMATNKAKSDTMAYIADVVTPLRRMHEDFMHDDNALDVLSVTAKSKLCFLDNSGDIVTIGEFYDVDGVLFSNTSYLKKTYSYNSYNAWWQKHVPATPKATPKALVPVSDDEDDDDTLFGRNGISYANYSVGDDNAVEASNLDLLDEALSHLPYPPYCQECEAACGCALDYPYCSSDLEAKYVSAAGEGADFYAEEKAFDCVL